MRDAGGAVRVADLADGAGCSHRHLVARFREQIGATPKTAARVLRYARAARLLARGDLPLSQVAALCGYADQLHMTREFATLAETTPGAVAATDGLDTTEPASISASLIRQSVSFKTSPARRPRVPP